LSLSAPERARRFPPPWTVEETAAYHNGQALTYVYFEDESSVARAAKLLARDEARRLQLISPSCQSC
jgi:hypothetical protein